MASIHPSGHVPGGAGAGVVAGAVAGVVSVTAVLEVAPQIRNTLIIAVSNIMGAGRRWERNRGCSQMFVNFDTFYHCCCLTH